MVTQEPNKNGVSYIVEDARDIHLYNKTLNAYKDYLLMQRIKELPDDMIREIKKYVMSPYKFMPEFKLFKIPQFFTSSFNNNRIYRVSDEGEHLYSYDNNGAYFYTIRQLDGSTKNLYCKKKKYYENFTKISNKTIRTLTRINNDLYDQKQLTKILKNLQIKGRSKMLLYKNYPSRNERNQTIVNAILKQED